jgi:hypothetical protein
VTARERHLPIRVYCILRTSKGTSALLSLSSVWTALDEAPIHNSFSLHCSFSKRNAVTYIQKKITNLHTSALKTEAAYTSEMLPVSPKSTRCNNLRIYLTLISQYVSLQNTFYRWQYNQLCFATLYGLSWIWSLRRARRHLEYRKRLRVQRRENLFISGPSVKSSWGLLKLNSI